MNKPSVETALRSDNNCNGSSNNNNNHNRNNNTAKRLDGPVYHYEMMIDERRQLLARNSSRALTVNPRQKSEDQSLLTGVWRF